MPPAFVRNTFFGFVSGGAIGLATVIGSVVATRLLGPEGAGVIAYAAWCIIVATTIVDLGIGMTLQRFLPSLRAEGNHDEAERLVGLTARLEVLAVFAGVLLLYGWLHWPGRAAMEASSGESDLVPIMLVLAGFVGKAMGDLYMAYLKGEQRFDALARLTLLTSSIHVLVTVGGAWMFGVPGALAAYVAGSSLPALLSTRLLGKRSYIGRDLRSRVVRFALTSWLAGVTGGLVWRAEIVFVEHYSGIRAVGLFAAALTLTQVATVLPSLLTSALLPYFSERHSLDARDQIHRVYQTMTGIVALLVIPACVGMTAITHVLVPLLFGAEFADVVPPALVLLLPAGVGVVADVTSRLIYSTGKTSILLTSNVVCLFGTILLAVLLIPRFGLVGAACSRVVVHMSAVSIETWYASRKLGFAPPYKALGAITLAALAQGLAAYGVVSVVGGVLSLVLAIPVAVGVYLLALRVLAVLRLLDPALADDAIAHAPRKVRWLLARIVKFISPGSDDRFISD